MKKMMIALLACFTLNLSASTHELFLVKKNFNPENILHFDANLTDDCKFKLDNPLHIYWILGNSPTKHAPGFPESSFLVTEYIEKTEDRVIFTNDAIKKVGTLLRNGLTATAGMTVDGKCEAKVLADTNEYGILTLTSIFGDLKTFFGIPYKVNHFVIEGLDEHGEVFKKKINKSLEK